MAQTRKQHVHDRILEAAGEIFAREGYASATVAQIAREAGVSTGNVYRYFDDREALFYACVTDAFAAELMRLVRRRVGALVWGRGGIVPGEQGQKDADELLAFWIDHRLLVVTVLDRAEGSRFEGYGAAFVDALVRVGVAWLREHRPGVRVTSLVRFSLRNCFESSRRAIVEILETYERPEDIRAAFAAFWSYQLAGLTGLADWANAQRRTE